jgi:hypothetical protein
MSAPPCTATPRRQWYLLAIPQYFTMHHIGVQLCLNSLFAVSTAVSSRHSVHQFTSAIIAVPYTESSTRLGTWPMGAAARCEPLYSKLRHYVSISFRHRLAFGKRHCVEMKTGKLFIERCLETPTMINAPHITSHDLAMRRALYCLRQHWNNGTCWSYHKQI